MRRPSALLAVFAVVFLAVSMTACGASNGGGDGTATTRFATAGTFTMTAHIPPHGFDPYGKLSAPGFAVLAYDSLVNLKPDGSFVSGIAQKWQVDAKSATFTLRPDVTCSDGTKLTATHVAKAITYNSDPKNGSTQYGLNTPTVPLTAKGDNTARTVRVDLTKPDGFLLHTLGLLPIVCPKGMQDPKMLATSSDGTGPFVLSKVVPGQSYTFTVRKGYAWGPGGATTRAPGTPATVVVRVIENESTAANLMLSGELNLTRVIGDDRQRLTGKDLKRLDAKTSARVLQFNEHKGRPTADKRVREALVAAIDRAQLTKISTGGTGSTAKGLLALEPTVCAGDTVGDQLPKHDVAAAGAKLDEAGWVKGADGTRRKNGAQLTVDLVYYPVTPWERSTVEYLAEQWQALGVKVNSPTYTFAKATEATYKTGDWDVSWTGFGFSVPSQMMAYLSGPTPPEGLNIGNFDNAEYNDLSAKAITMTPPEACPYWIKAERAIIGDLGVVPVATGADQWFLRKAQVTMQRYFSPVPTSIRVFE